MAHRSSLLRRLSIALVILIGAGLLMAGGFVFLYIHTAQQQEQQSMEAWRSTFDSSYEKNKQALTSGKDVNTLLIAVNDFQADLKGWPVPIPAEPQLLGISLLTSEQLQARTSAIAQATKTTKVIGDTQALLTYQTKVSSVFTPVNNPQATNLDQLKTLSNAWSTAAAGFASITPPVQAQPIQQKFGQALGAVTTSIATLVRLYQQQDSSGFTAERPAFVSALTEFQKVDNQLATQTQTQISTLMSQLQVLTAALSDY